MKAIIEGMKRAKVRSLLSAVVVIVCILAVAFSLYRPGGFRGEQRNLNLADINNGTYEQKNRPEDATSEDSGIKDDTDRQETVPFNVNKDNIRRDIKRGAYMSYIIAAAIIVTGILLLIFINAISTKKRKEEFKEMQANGIVITAIRKQLFIESFVIVFAAGFITAGISAAVIRPAMPVIMSGDNRPEIPDTEAGNSFGKAPDGNIADDSIMDNKPNNDISISDDDTRGRFKNDESYVERGDRSNRAPGRIPGIIVSIIGVLLMSMAAGISCAMPVKKEEVNIDYE